MKSDFELILEECLAQMRAGKTLEECLSSHPLQAKRLRPLLQAAAQVREIPVPRARQEAVQAGRERLLASVNLRNLSSSPVSSGLFARYTKHTLSAISIILFGKKRSGLSLAFRMAAIFAITLLGTAGITVNASARSLPGDRLYSVKRSWENVRISLALSQQGRQKLQERFSAERREEIQELIHLRRAETVEFEAPLEAMDANRWQVNGFQVQIESDTEVEGVPETGLALYVRARLLEDGTLTAIQVRVPTQRPHPSSPTSTPEPGLTPKLDENPETEDTETPQNLSEPSETPQPTKVKSAENDSETVYPTQEPEKDATQTPTSYGTRTPDPTEQHEKEGTPEPTETRKPTQTPDATEKHHETPEATNKP